MSFTKKDKEKIVCFWLTNEEQRDNSLRDALQEQYRQWIAKGFLPVVFLSGNDDLYESTLDLLRYNRRRSAERQACAEANYA